MVGLIWTLFNLSHAVHSRCRSVQTVRLAINLEALSHSQLPLGPVDALAAVRPTKKPQYESISSPHPLLLHLHSPHPLLHLQFDPSPVLALPRAPCIVIVDNAPWRLDGFGHPHCLHLVLIGFGFGISFAHIRNFFIATDVLLRKKPLQCEQPCVLVARGWHQDPRWCCLLLGDRAFKYRIHRETCEINYNLT